MRLILQKFGLAVGIVWTAVVGICWLFLLAIGLARLDDGGMMIVGIATAVAIAAVFIGWLVVLLWIWIFEP